MTIINMTPRTVYGVGHNPIRPSGKIAEIHRRLSNVKKIDGIMIFEVGFAIAKNLPYETDGTYYIVSEDVRLAFPDRIDLLSISEHFSVNTGFKSDYLIKNPTPGAEPDCDNCVAGIESDRNCRTCVGHSNWSGE